MFDVIFDSVIVVVDLAKRWPVPKCTLFIFSPAGVKPVTFSDWEKIDRQCGGEQGGSSRETPRKTADCGGNAAGGSKLTEHNTEHIAGAQ